MTRLILTGIIASIVFLSLVAVAHADKDRAKRHLDRAVEYFSYERYESAAREFEKSYEHDPDTRTLFAWAQAERLAGNCVKATLLYQQFLETEPQQAAADAASFGVEECKKELDVAATTNTVPGPSSDRDHDSKPDSESGESPRDTGDSTSARSRGDETAPMVTDSSAVDDPSGPEPWYADRMGAVLTGGGGGLVVLGLGLYVSARGLANTAPDEANDETEFDDIVGRAAFRRNIAVVLSLAGAAAATLGVLRYKRVRAEQNSSVQVSPTLGPDSAGLVIQGRF